MLLTVNCKAQNEDNCKTIELLMLTVKDVSPRLPLDTSRLPRLTAKWKFAPTRDKHQKEDDAETRSDD
jgi:hypothetical protein